MLSEKTVAVFSLGKTMPKPCPFRTLFMPVSCLFRVRIVPRPRVAVSVGGRVDGQGCAQFGRWQLRTGRKAVAPMVVAPRFVVAPAHDARAHWHRSSILRSEDEFVR